LEAIVLERLETDETFKNFYIIQKLIFKKFRASKTAINWLLSDWKSKHHNKQTPIMLWRLQKASTLGK